MNYKRNLKYFEQVNKTYPIVISAVLIAVGFIMVIFYILNRRINEKISRITRRKENRQNSDFNRNFILRGLSIHF